MRGGEGSGVRRAMKFCVSATSSAAGGRWKKFLCSCHFQRGRRAMEEISVFLPFLHSRWAMEEISVFLPLPARAMEEISLQNAHIFDKTRAPEALLKLRCPKTFLCVNFCSVFRFVWAFQKLFSLCAQTGAARRAFFYFVTSYRSQYRSSLNSFTSAPSPTASCTTARASC